MAPDDARRPGLPPQPRWGYSPTIADKNGCVFTADGQFHYRLAGDRQVRLAGAGAWVDVFAAGQAVRRRW